MRSLKEIAEEYLHKLGSNKPLPFFYGKTDWNVPAKTGLLLLNPYFASLIYEVLVEYDSYINGYTCSIQKSEDLIAKKKKKLERYILKHSKSNATTLKKALITESKANQSILNKLLKDYEEYAEYITMLQEESKKVSGKNKVIADVLNNYLTTIRPTIVNMLKNLNTQIRNILKEEDFEKMSKEKLNEVFDKKLAVLKNDLKLMNDELGNLVTMKAKVESEKQELAKIL